MFPTEVRQPVPAEHALHTDHDVFQIGKDDVEQDLRAGLQVVVIKDLPFPVNDTDVHGSGMQIDTAVVLVFFLIKTHGVASFG